MVISLNQILNVSPNLQTANFNCHQFFSTNKQYVKITLIQNETNRKSIFFGKDEILVKL